MELKRIQQITDSHCGPAVLEMLLLVYGGETSQQEIAKQAGVLDTIEEYGTRVDHLGLASSKIAPHLQFWWKEFSTLDDLRFILSKDIAVGVEWQGLFYDTEEEEEENEYEGTDFGHFSVIKFIDDDDDTMIFTDPDKDFPQENRIFSVPIFYKRWWDTEQVPDPITGRSLKVQDTRLLFFVAPMDVEIPPEYKFKRFSKSTLQHWYHLAKKQNLKP
jgi:hypothetical protein